MGVNTLIEGRASATKKAKKRAKTRLEQLECYWCESQVQVSLFNLFNEIGDTLGSE